MILPWKAGERDLNDKAKHERLQDYFLKFYLHNLESKVNSGYSWIDKARANPRLTAD